MGARQVNSGDRESPYCFFFSESQGKKRILAKLLVK